MLSLTDIRDAHDRIRDKITRTPVMTSRALDAQAGATLFFKCENLQKSGAFKVRGATNAVFSLSGAEMRNGVVTHSSGNHAAALARAAGLRSIPAHVVMPTNSPAAKIASVRRYGGRIVFCEPTLESRERTADEVRRETGATFIHPYNDVRVMAGQGTTAIELLADVPELDVLLCPVGGGGLLSGISVATRSLSRTRVIGVEPAGADDAAQSFQTGRLVGATAPQTIADGLRTSLGELPFHEIRRHVDAIVTVSEDSIIRAMRMIWEVMKLVVEPSGAVPFASVLEKSLDYTGKRVGLVLTGGNVDLDRLPWQAPGTR